MFLFKLHCLRLATTGPSMFLSKLSDLFGHVVNQDELWPRIGHDSHIGFEMHALLHQDLRDQQRKNYNHEHGLLDLYHRAYERAVSMGKMDEAEHKRTRGYYPAMQKVAEKASPDLDNHVLIRELRAIFCPKGRSWDFETFYPQFLEPYTHDRAIAERLFNVLDSDQSGKVCSFELVTACKWVLREFQGTEDDTGGSIDTLNTLIRYVIEEWVVPEALINQMCVAPGQSKDSKFFISEPEPATQPGPGGVQTLTGKTVRDAVIKSDKSILVAFYNPHCQHCLQMLPELAATAAALVDDPTVVLAKMDVVANSVPEPFEVATVPTLYWKGEQQFPFVYRGLRNSGSMLNFIKTKHSMP